MMLPDKAKKLLAKAVQLRKENKKFVLGLYKRKDLDKMFHSEHERVFEKTDCLACANCCKTTSPIFRDVDIERISKHLGMKPAQLIDQHLHLDSDQDYVLNTSPCTFLGDDNYCRIYDVRPRACRDYPHTDRKNMMGILELTYHNTLVCPAVAEMVENIKKAVDQKKS
jgi:Fe-S-cluster containining protein